VTNTAKIKGQVNIKNDRRYSIITVDLNFYTDRGAFRFHNESCIFLKGRVSGLIRYCQRGGLRTSCSPSQSGWNAIGLPVLS
jgi:hypothetical protein